MGIPRLSRFVARNQDDLAEVFTSAELAAAADRRQRDLYLATRWALKEAVLKALGTGWGAGIAWTDVEAVGGLFAPRVLLHAAADEVARRQGACEVIASAARAGPWVIAVAALVPSTADADRGPHREILPG